MGDGSGAFQLARFVEKPDRNTAESYLAAGDYLWNSGIFVLRASVWLAALGVCHPEMLAACQSALANGKTDGDFVRVINSGQRPRRIRPAMIGPERS